MSSPNQLPPGYVPVPNALFDTLLPDLSDTDLRVLLVVTRSTLGWRHREPDGTVQYKKRDWITNTQFVRRTGRSSTAVSAAIKTLVSKELIVVENFRGEQLRSASERRHIRGRLFYRLGDDMWKLCKSSDIANVASTTNKYYNINNKEAGQSHGMQRASDILHSR